MNTQQEQSALEKEARSQERIIKGAAKRYFEKYEVQRIDSFTLGCAIALETLEEARDNPAVPMEAVMDRLFASYIMSKSTDVDVMLVRGDVLVLPRSMADVAERFMSHGAEVHIIDMSEGRDSNVKPDDFN